MLILGVDYGRRRVGVATGNLETGNCTPLTVLSPKDSVSWRKLFARWQPGLCCWVALEHGWQHESYGLGSLRLCAQAGA